MIGLAGGLVALTLAVGFWNQGRPTVATGTLLGALFLMVTL